jgi:hypothetical protein
MSLLGDIGHFRGSRGIGHSTRPRKKMFCGHVDMPLGEVLPEAGSTLSHVYFPTTATVSLLYVMQNGESAEIAVVGNDGVVGISLFMGGDSPPSRALIVPVAVTEPGSPSRHPHGNDPGTDRSHAWRAP